MHELVDDAGTHPGNVHHESHAAVEEWRGSEHVPYTLDDLVVRRI